MESVPRSPLNFLASACSGALATVSLTGAGARGTWGPQGCAFSPKEAFTTDIPLQRAGPVFPFHCLFDQTLIHSTVPPAQSPLYPERDRFIRPGLHLM